MGHLSPRYVLMSHCGHMLFAGTNNGMLRSLKFPLTVPGEGQEHMGHRASITKVCKLAQKSFASPGNKFYSSKTEDTKIILYIRPYALEI